MGKKKKAKAPPKPFENGFEGLSDGMERFWKSARDNIYEKRGEKLLEYLDKVDNENGEEVSCPNSGYAIIPDRILELKDLKTIDFNHNLIEEDNIPKEFWLSDSLKNLTCLDLSHNQMSCVPSDRDDEGFYKNLANVKTLRLNHNQIRETAAELRALTNVTEVTLNNNSNLSDFREEYGEWVNLTYLDVSYNQISSFPSSMANWSELRVLKAKDNKMIALPDTLGACAKLEKLNLAYNVIAELPTSIMALSVLEELDLTKNGLSALPEQMMYLHSLKKLYCGQNDIKPPSVNHIVGLVKLEDLFMPRNLLTTIPKDIGNLINLRRVSFAGNKMKSLPNEIGEWTKIEEVYLNKNDYEKLPNSIQEWVNLVELHVRDCDKLSVMNPKVAFPLTLMRMDLRGTQLEVADEWGEPPKGLIPKRIPPFNIKIDKGKGKGGGKKKK